MSDWIPIKLVEQSMAVRDAEIAELKAELRKKAIDSISDIGQLGELSAENVHLQAENARLKAEVERLKIDAYKKLSMRIEIDKLKARIEYLTNAGTANELRLKAEVERLRSASFVTAVPSDDYERVVKAGNALRDDLEALTKSTWFNKCKSVKNWNSATYQ